MTEEPKVPNPADVTEEDVRNALRSVMDPELHLDVIALGLIETVDIQEGFTPLTINYVLEQAKPDLILLAMATEDLGLGDVPGVDILADALREELASASDIPLIEVARN